MATYRYLYTVFILLCSWGLVSGAQKAPDETPGLPGEWGFKPAAGELLELTPPGFSWRPQDGAIRYGLQVSHEATFDSIAYEEDSIDYTVHCPPATFSPGSYYWRFRFNDGESWSGWSSVRNFTIVEEAAVMPLPARKDLLARIPTSHPRLFVRPEWIDDLKARAQSDLKSHYDKLIQECDELVANPPPSAEPPLYPEGTVRGSDPWRTIWWGNRTYTQKVLNGAATLAFAYLLNGDERYAALSRELLMDCADWDPVGSTGFVYNDEAAMPYNYYFSRTYTFLHAYLSEAEREKCREIMTVRGREMYDHLHPDHLWKPYGSHSNRSWHFLGEVGIAFLNEIPEASEWVWFAMNVFMNVYPVWSDNDGGWHEGMQYWQSYNYRFTWWADVMRAATGINAFEKPYFSQAGYYAMYLSPPGTKGGGFGDLTARISSSHAVKLVSVYSAQAQNPYWQWYVDSHEGEYGDSGYVGFIRGSLPKVEPREPTDLPTSRLFRGIGQAMLNSDLSGADNNVEIIFKSSPFGTQSHGYESQNAFLLYAFGERLFIRTGRRDSYGSEHHKKWMWQTKSVNSITVNGQGQMAHSAAAQGEITEFKTTEHFDWVVGEAAGAYPEGTLNRFTRRILFCKPEVIIIHDILEAPEASTFEWLLHSENAMQINSQHDISVISGEAAGKANFLWPAKLEIAYTDKFETPPRPRIQLTEYHLTASTSDPSLRQEFVTILRPHRVSEKLSGKASLEKTKNGFVVEVPTSSGPVQVELNESVRAVFHDSVTGQSVNFSSKD